MRTRFWLILFLIGSVPAYAQNAPGLKACEKTAHTQIELDRCGSNEATSADAELAQVYSRLLTLVAPKEGAVERVQSAQNAWLTYRTVYIEAMFPSSTKSHEYGSSYPMFRDLYYASVTRRQVAALREMIDWYTPR